ncbi:MAG TPA: DUF6457 domain-containing protein [Actinomycetota bacterium]
MDRWLDQLAEALGVDPLGPEETREILGLSRDVAHRVERRYAPLASFLLGAAAGRTGQFQDAVERLRALLPPESDQPSG